MVTEIYKAVDLKRPAKDDIQGADDYIRQLSELDPDSTSFRYAHMKDGTPSLPAELIRINVRHFAVTISRPIQYIDDMDTATSIVGEWQDEVESRYGAQSDY